MNYFKKFLYVFSGHRKQLIILTLIFLLTSILEGFGIGLIGPFLNLAGNPDLISDTPQLLGIYDYLGLQSPGQLVGVLGLLVVFVFLVKAVLYFFGKRYSYKVIFSQRAAIQERLFNVYLSVSYDFHLARNTADYINKISVETYRFVYMVSLPIIESLSHIIIVAILLVLMARTNVALFIISLASLFPVIIIFSFLIKHLKRWGHLSTIAREETIKAVSHGLGGIKETRVFNCEEYFRLELREHIYKEAHMETLFQSVQFLPRTLIETFLVIALIGFVCFSQLLIGQDFQAAVSSMGVFAVASLRLVPAASQLVEIVGKLRNSIYTLDTMYLDLKEIENKDLDGLAQSDKGLPIRELTFSNNLELENIFYQYPSSDTPSLKGISMQVRKGESIGLIGQSGAGKTTLVDVILALLTPQEGDITVDGHSIYNNLSSWNKLVGYIPQSIFLMDDTIEKNIAFGVSTVNIDQDRLWYAIKAAQLESFIKDLPDGISTSVGERGVRLSGGQRQRIGIARALYHQREILILDEATSALDNETERLISESVSALAGSKTLIIIAHRLSTIEHCDRIYVLDKGTVARSGTYADVVLAPQK